MVAMQVASFFILHALSFFCRGRRTEHHFRTDLKQCSSQKCVTGRAPSTLEGTMSRSGSPVLGLGPGEKPRRKLTDELDSSDDEYDERVLRSSPFSLTPATGTTPVAGADVATISTAATSIASTLTPVARSAADTAASAVVTSSGNARKANHKAVATPAAKKRKAKTTTKRFETYEDVTDLIEFPNADGSVERREIDFDHKPIPVGSLVRVAKRTFPGSNKYGGVGKVTARNGAREDNNLTYDVVYVLGGVEKDIHYAYVVLDGAFGYTTTPRKRQASPAASSSERKKNVSTQSAKKKERKRPAKTKAKPKASAIISPAAASKAPEPFAPRYRVGQVVEKYFKGYGTFVGKIAELPSEDMPYYRVVYEDGDAEDIHEDDISDYVVGAAFPGSNEARRLSKSIGSTTEANAVVKAELLEKGVRVVVDHRGASYKATIRKVGEGDGGRTTEEDRYLVHYDGQKHSITHWIALSQIRGLICEEE